MTLDEIRKAIVPACRKFDVSRFHAFGSTARGCATGTSDVELQVEFKDLSRSPAKRFFGLLHRKRQVM